MSHENVEIVRRCLEFWANRDWSVALELLDPSVEFDLSRRVFNPTVYRGIAEVEQLVSGADAAWDNFRVTTDDLIDAGDRVLAALTIKGKGRESGIDVSMQIFQIWTLRGAKVVRMVSGYRDRSEALEAAGLSESDAQGSP